MGEKASTSSKPHYQKYRIKALLLYSYELFEMFNATSCWSIWKKTKSLLNQRTAFEFYESIVGLEIETALAKDNLFLECFWLEAKHALLHGFGSYLGVELGIDKYPSLFHFGGNEGIVGFETRAIAQQQKLTPWRENLFKSTCIGDVDFFGLALDYGSSEKTILALFEVTDGERTEGFEI